MRPVNVEWTIGLNTLIREMAPFTLSKSTRDMTGQARAAPTNEATFPTTIVARLWRTVKHRLLDNRSPIGNQEVISKSRDTPIPRS
jgi:hypothetical protein